MISTSSLTLTWTRRTAIALIFGLSLAPAAAQDRFITVASTTSTEQSGLFGHLLPKFTQKTGIGVRVVAQGAGQALKTAERGDADVVFVHDPAAAPALSAAAPDRAAPGKSVATMFGEIVWLMSQSALHKSFRIADLEWLVMAPVLLRQFRLISDGDKPVGAVLYAFLSEEAEARLEAGTGRLSPQDWKSGDRAWIVEVLAPFGDAEAFAQNTAATVLADRTAKMHVTDKGGRRAVIVGGEERG